MTVGFHPFQGRPSFGQPSDTVSIIRDRERFHPFQGRPSFGPLKLHSFAPTLEEMFPSLSGKTFIRTM